MIPHRSTLIDDDGALVLSTAQQMAAIAARGFTYDYPTELLTHMAGGRIVAWETGGEGDCSVEVILAAEPPAAALGPFRLDALPGDTGLVMPYSQFSYAADCAAGSVGDTPGLVLRFPIAPGAHDVFLGAAPGGCRIIVTPARHPPAAVRGELPVLSPIAE
jgi:hypothetical protein